MHFPEVYECVCVSFEFERKQTPHTNIEYFPKLRPFIKSSYTATNKKKNELPFALCAFFIPAHMKFSHSPTIAVQTHEKSFLFLAKYCLSSYLWFSYAVGLCARIVY